MKNILHCLLVLSEIMMMIIIIFSCVKNFLKNIFLNVFHFRLTMCLIFWGFFPSQKNLCKNENLQSPKACLYFLLVSKIKQKYVKQNLYPESNNAKHPSFKRFQKILSVSRKNLKHYWEFECDLVCLIFLFRKEQLQEFL